MIVHMTSNGESCFGGKTRKEREKKVKGEENVHMALYSPETNGLETVAGKKSWAKRIGRGRYGLGMDKEGKGHRRKAERTDTKMGGLWLRNSACPASFPVKDLARWTDRFTRQRQAQERKKRRWWILYIRSSKPTLGRAS